MRIRWVDARKPFVIALLCTVVVASCVVTFMTTAQAANLSWAHSDIHYTKVSDQALYTYPPTGYPNKTVMLGGLGGLRPVRSAYISYFHERGAWAYGDYSYGGNEFPFVSSHGTAIRVGSDQNMYRVTPAFPHAVGDVPGTDDLIFPIDNLTSGFHFTYYKNFPSKLRHQTQTTGEVAYSYDQTPDFVLRRPNGTDISYSGAIGTSDNGKWAVLNAWGVGVVRVNLETFEVKRISTQTYEYDPRRMPMSPEFAISNDGAHVAIIGRYVPLEVYDVSDTCGDKITDAMTPATPIASPCPVRDITDLMIHNYGPAFETAYSPSFDDGGGQLTLYATAYGGQSPPLWIQLTVDGYTPTPQITYLALGDSYSSGEGDINSDGEATHYLGTTGGGGGCHLSGRSYPYLLRDYYQIPTNSMKSVACSGARVVFDYNHSLEGYEGQGDRLAWLNDKLWLKDEQRSAMENFVPGEVPQLEFVKKYKPKIITLTGGGNDVGFANVLTYCASPEIILRKIPVSYTCDYAKKGSKLEGVLYNSIDTQYMYNKRLIQAIKEESPSSRIIIIDYPSFIAEGTAVCGLNGGDLNSDERAMIQHAIQYMNSMLLRVAYDTNVNFVDIQDSLQGGRICEGSQYMTGLYRTGILHGSDGAFHPNAAGHEKIAETIEESGAMLTDTTLHSSDYSYIGGVISLMLNMVPGGSIVRSHSLPLVFGANIFAGNSDVTASAYSSQISLGTVHTKADGSVDTNLKSDDLPIGNHVLVLRGVSPSGDPIETYQFIEIRAAAEDGGNDAPSNLQSVRHVLDGERASRVQQRPSEVNSMTSGGEMLQTSSDFKDNYLKPQSRDVPVKLPQHTATIVGNKNIFAAMTFICCIGVVGGVYVYKKR